MAPPRKPRPACAICGRPVKRPLKKFCSRACRDEALKREPNSGSFPAGAPAPNRVPVGTVRIRHRIKRDDGPRAWVKTADPNVWRPRAVVVWEASHGPVPRGCIVHHENRDTLDDDLSNLELVSRAAHLREHRPEFEQKRARAASAARWGTK